ncbi:MAG: DsbC family protein [Burkholderiales bacterium]
MKPIILFALLFFIAAHAVAESAEFAELREILSQRIPDMTLGEIRKLPHADLYEVQVNGYDVFYTDRGGNIGVRGSLVDLNARVNLTDRRKQELMVVDFSALPLDQAITKVKGNGSRKMAIFSDPDCPHCKRLERELADVTDATIYIFLYPLAQLHPDAPRKARAVWCAPQPAKAWDELMLEGREPAAPPDDCHAPLGVIAEWARKLWIAGTPGIVFENGRLVPGVIARSKIEAHLSGS